MRRALTFAMVLTMAAGLLSCGKSPEVRDLYDSENRFRSDITLEEIRSLPCEHGDLIGVMHYEGGGMEGGSHGLELSRQEDGSGLAVTRSAGSHVFPLVVREYRTDGEVFAALQELADRDKLALWEDLPEEEFLALDAPSESLTLVYDDSALGGSSYNTFRISYDNVFPQGGGAVLQDFLNTIQAFVSSGDLMDQYFLINGERVVTGRDTDNTDDEIGTLVSGYWLETEEETGMLLFGYGLEETLDFRMRTEDTYGDFPLTFREIVHRPWEEGRCGWYVSLEDDEGSPWVLYIEDMSMILCSEDGTSRHVLERQD